jgi:hypothetical protein
MAPRWLIAAAAILTLSGFSMFSAPAIAGEDHPHYTHVPAREHLAPWRRSSLAREAAIHHAEHARVIHTRRHFQPPHHEAYRR